MLIILADWKLHAGTCGENSALAYVWEHKELFCCITNVLAMNESEN